jgi:hypothetical protein
MGEAEGLAAAHRVYGHDDRESGYSRQRLRLLGLVVIVVPTLFANAFLTAVLSSSDSRYQARVIWLVPLLAALVALDLLGQRDNADRDANAQQL